MPTFKNASGKSVDQKTKELKKQNAELLNKIQLLEDSKSKMLNIFSVICSLLSSGFFVYNFKERTFSNSYTLSNLFENCFSDNDTINEKALIENAHPDDKPFLEELFSIPKTQKRKINGQFRLTQKIKDYKDFKWFLVNGAYNYPDENDPILICAIRDITKEIKQQKELQRSLEKAEDSDKIKTTFLLNISHTIRTPMNSILGFAELLSMTEPEPARLEKYIQVIKRQSKSLLQLIDHVAEIAKYESGTMSITKTCMNTNVLINEVLHETDIIRSTHRREQVIIKTKPASKNGIEIYSDIGRIHQIFINLLNYSLRYTYEGKIEIGYRMPEENKIEFFVHNTGYLASKEDLKYFFNRYSQINAEDFDRYDDETGLGLTIAKSIAHLLGGKMYAESDVETGTSFFFHIPYATSPDSQQEFVEEETSLSAQFNWKGKVILIVEDEEVNGLFLEAVFQETGAQILYVKNGKQAVELCMSINKIDLILMDIRMPVMNGIKATKEIRKINPTVPIIAQTALNLQEDKESCRIAGCNDSIIKPIEVEELLSLVNKYLTH
ncbi:MAG: response regulator [Bacteroidales bacterium]|nr:response regulator [Bacteroidales bacterium]